MLEFSPRDTEIPLVVWKGKNTKLLYSNLTIMSSTKLGFNTTEGEQNNKYVFSSGGYSASARLNPQYFMFEWQTSYQVNPLVPLDRENLQIANIGTGSGHERVSSLGGVVLTLQNLAHRFEPQASSFSYT
jgi:hypothetical protein